jgi:hypothetical protein
MRHIFSVPFVISALLCISHAEAATITLGPTDDAYTEVFTPDTNYGGSYLLATNLGNLSQRQYSYLKFDLGSIPSNEVIVGATLNLYQVNGAGSGISGVNLFRLPDDSWDEMTVTWNDHPDTTGYTLLDTNPNGYNYVGWSQWNLFASGAFDPSTDRTDGLLSLWLAEASSNNQARLLCSKEASTDTTGTCSAGLEPYLLITTATVPVPGALWLFGSGLLGLAGIARHRPVA